MKFLSNGRGVLSWRKFNDDENGAEIELSNPFPLAADKLTKLCADKSIQYLQEIGGVQGIAIGTKTDLVNGLSQEEEDLGYEARHRQYGRNIYPEPPIKSFFRFFWEGCQDTTVQILFAAAIASLLLGIFADRMDPSINPCDLEKDEFYMKEYSTIPGWAEGVSILVAVLVVAFVTAANNFSKEKQFRSLNDVKNNRRVQVVRNCQRRIISIFDINVGEIVHLDTGDQVPADGILVNGHNLETDESAITGESDSVRKDQEHPFLLSGCQVVAGVGTMVVTAVGENSEWGMTLAKLSEAENDETPLQKKLDKAAQLIGYIGVGAAVATFTALTIIWSVEVSRCQNVKFKWTQLSALLDFFIMAITIVVVAVPEGLPLAVTISLAYSMRSMLKDNILVRHLEACETMGGATNVCCDKTGTLTENRMTVEQCYFGNKFFSTVPNPSELTPAVLDLINEGIAINSNAYLNVKPNGVLELVGNKTEGAMLVMTRKLGADYEAIRKRLEPRIKELYAFSSEKKRMGVIIENSSSNFRLYVKGAAERVLELCTSSLNPDGSSSVLDETTRKMLQQIIDQMAIGGLRSLCIAYRDLPQDNSAEWEEAPPDDNLIFIGLVGIKDPLRPEVIKSVGDAKKAGIFVRMVTGDNLFTAKCIGTECGILTDGGVAVDAKDIRSIPDEELDAMLPRLQIVARATPTDKYRLVKRLRTLGEVVGVTGDGTNDGPALKEADVGLAMNLSGTEVAKEASDIVLMDDNFTSIVKSVLWGRAVYENIRKFVQFQLTVNVVALVVAFISAVTGKGRPLKPIQLLWVNMIMDTMGALALGTEKPTNALLHRKPYGRYDALISPTMWRNILGQSLYQLAVVFFVLYYGNKFFESEMEYYYEPKYGRAYGVEYIPSLVVNTVLFNSFVFCQIFNEFNCRKISDFNIVEGLFSNWLFSFIIAVTVVAQVLIVELGGPWFDTVHLTWHLWLFCVAVGAFTIPWGLLLKLIPVPPEKTKAAPAGPKPVEQRREELRRSIDLVRARDEIKHGAGSVSLVVHRAASGEYAAAAAAMLSEQSSSGGASGSPSKVFRTPLVEPAALRS